MHGSLHKMEFLVYITVGRINIEYGTGMNIPSSGKVCQGSCQE